MNTRSHPKSPGAGSLILSILALPIVMFGACVVPRLWKPALVAGALLAFGTLFHHWKG